MMKGPNWIVLAAGLLPGLLGSHKASAAIIYQNTNTYVLTGNSDIVVGNYGLTSPDATFVIQATATWATNANIAEMLFNSAGGPPGPDLYFVDQCGGQGIAWNSYNECSNELAAMPASANNGSVHTYVLVEESSAGTTDLYYDGTLLGAAAYIAPEDNLSIGGDSNGFYWTGTISGVTIYDTALTADEVAALEPSSQAAPEPSSMALIVSALFGLRLMRRRKG